jgi:hypothetical protein
VSSKIVIVYSPYQHVVRCVYLPDHDSEVPGLLARIQGHKSGKLGVIVLNKDMFLLNNETPQQMLNLALGITPSSDVCNVMSGADIVGGVQADPLLDFELLGMGQTLSQ